MDIFRKDSQKYVPRREDSSIRAHSTSVYRTTTLTMKTTQETAAGTDARAPPSRSAECKRLSFNPKDMSLSFGYRAAIKAVESAANRDNLINSEISYTHNDLMTQNKLTVKAHMNKHWQSNSRDAGPDTNRSKSAQVNKDRLPASRVAPFLKGNISRTINSEASLTDLQNKTTQDKSKECERRYPRQVEQGRNPRRSVLPQRDLILKKPLKTNQRAGFIRSLETSQIAEQQNRKPR